MMLSLSLSTLVRLASPVLENSADQPGKTKDEEDVTGTITVPEVAHDTEENEYVVCFLVPHGRHYIAQLTSRSLI